MRRLPIVNPAPGDLNLLRTFVAVAQLGSFTAAAERLDLARPQVSVQVKRLETALGVSLFNRTTRRVALTDAGQRLFEQCAPLLQGVQEALEQIGSRSAQAERVGCASVRRWSTPRRCCPLS